MLAVPSCRRCVALARNGSTPGAAGNLMGDKVGSVKPDKYCRGQVRIACSGRIGLDVLTQLPGGIP